MEEKNIIDRMDLKYLLSMCLHLRNLSLILPNLDRLLSRQLGLSTGVTHIRFLPLTLFSQQGNIKMDRLCSQEGSSIQDSYVLESIRRKRINYGFRMEGKNMNINMDSKC